MTKRIFISLLLPALFLTAPAAQAQEELDIVKAGDAAKLVPLALTGFSGEAQSALRFDLEVMGFRIVPAAEAQYELRGKTGAGVEGTLFDKVANKPVFGRAYTGGSARTQSHALADDVAEEILKLPGI